MATCKDCFFKCYTDDADCVEATCNFFLPKDKYAEVVRCKDCKHYHARGHNGNSTIWDCKKKMCCRSANMSVKPDDFCSYGERREGE